MLRCVASSCVLALSLFAFAAAGESPAAAGAPSQAAIAARRVETGSAPAVAGLTYRLNQVAPGVFAAVAAGVPYYISNSVVIVGDEGVAVVDAGAGPAEARALRAAIATVTPLPVRYLIDTHFHFDHAFGSESFPEAVIVGHEMTREALRKGALETRAAATFAAGLPGQIDEARAAAAAEQDPQKRADAGQRAGALEAYLRELRELQPVAPSITFTDRLTLWLGARELRLMHLGRGHTAGDIVVLLPRERVVCTGDLFNGYIGFMGDAYVDEWAETLGRLAREDFDIVIPGHGAPFRGKEAIAPVQACQRDIWRQASALKQNGVPADAAAAQIDLRGHAGRFPDLARAGFNPVAVRRIYEVIDERAVRK
jgi:glyoxylase-like metal-dependent hydrolase (beta-lactamase superfamily II)